jgi:uncharacterized protein YndB with AHSA1/START domain
MAAIVSRLEIDQLPEEVFDYVTDPTRFAEWQENVVRGWMTEGQVPGLGVRYSTVRRIGGRERITTMEITEYNPPTSWAACGVDGPIRAIARVLVEPLSSGSGSRVTTEVEFEGHGIGKLLVPLVARRQAQKETPTNRRKLIERLMSGPAF